MNSIHAQTLVNKEWEVHSTGSPKTDVSWSASLTDASGNLYYVGNQVSSTQGYDVLMVKLGPEGDSIWQSTYNHDSTYDDFGVAIAMTSAGDLRVAAVSFSGTDSTADYVLLAVSESDGTIEWSESFNGAGDNHDLPTDLVIDDSDNSYLTGSSMSDNGDYDVATIKYDDTGSHEWTVYHDESGYDDGGAKILFDNDELYITGASGQSLTDWDYLLLTYDTDGALQDSEDIDNPGVGFDKPAAMAVDEDGNIYITGAASSDGIHYQVQTVKLDTGLNDVWVETWGIDSLDDGGLDLVLGDSGMVYVAGFEGRSGGSETHILTEGYDTDGVIRWQRSYAISGMPAGQPLLLSVTNPNIVYVQGIKVVAGQDRYVTLKYATINRLDEIVLDSTGNPSHRAKEVIVRFDPSALLMSKINKRDVVFGRVNEFVKSSVVTQMENKLGTGGSLATAPMYKVFKRLIPNDSISISRSGKTLKMPDFWATFVLQLPDNASRSGLTAIAAADSLNQLGSDIWFAELNAVGISHASDPEYDNGNQKSLLESTIYPDSDINMPAAWAKEVGDATIRVGVYDSGIDYTHEEFGTASLGSLTGSKIIDGFDFENQMDIESLNNPDWSRHGTACAGIIGAIRKNDLGIAGIAGGNDSLPNSDPRKTGVSLYALRLDDVGTFTAENIADAVLTGASKGYNYGYGLFLSNHSYGIEAEDLNNTQYLNLRGYLNLRLRMGW